MAKFGTKSLSILATVDDALVEVMQRVVAVRDITIISGKRGKAEQDDLVRRGLSRTRWPHSKHNQSRGGVTDGKSLAVDIAPYPIDWKDLNTFIYVAGMVKAFAADAGVTVIWGGDWSNDGVIIKDQTFQDLGHFELKL